MKFLHKFTHNKKRIPKHHLSYRPKLDDLPAFCEAKLPIPVDISQLIANIPLSAHADFSTEIYAIIPVQTNLWSGSCLIYRNTLALVEEMPEQLAKQLLTFSEHLDFTVYKQTLNHLLDANKRHTPIATRHYSLFPTGGLHVPQTIWINPGRIEHIHPQEQSSVLCFENLFTLDVPCPLNIIHRRMHHAFLAHAIIKREHNIDATQITTSLLEFLNITSSPETRAVLKNLQYQHIPKYKNEFFEVYPKFNQLQIKKDVKRRLYAELNMEE
jgi:ComK protein.